MVLSNEPQLAALEVILIVVSYSLIGACE